jgi:hypothetical protein
MALDNNAADQALEIYIASIIPPPADGGVALRASMRPLVRAIYAGIVLNAIVLPNTFACAAAPGPVAGTGKVA